MPAHLLSNPPPQLNVETDLEAIRIVLPGYQLTPAALQHQLHRARLILMLLLFFGIAMSNVIPSLSSIFHPLLIILLIILLIAGVARGAILTRLHHLLSRLFQRLTSTSLTLHPTKLVVTKRRRKRTILYENIASIDGNTAVELILQDGTTTTLPDTQHLPRESLFWLQNVVSESARAHRKRLTEAGHDLTERARIPEALLHTRQTRT